MKQQYFMTSTGTEIGKTLVTAGLVAQYGYKAFKPLISGVTDQTMAGSDTDILARAQGMQPCLQTWDHLSPMRFKAPLAPSMAAQKEGRSLDYNQLIQLCRGWLSLHDQCLIEGVGGSFVPLVDDILVIDWIKDLNIPCLLVVGSYLGTISHTIATIEAMQNRGVVTERLYVSESAGDDHPDFHDSCAELKRVSDLPVIPIPRIHRADPWRFCPPLLQQR